LVEAVEATSSQSTLLNIRSGFPILRRTITMYLQHDELVITGPIAIIIA
jgi:DNA-binding GntR family transcriptional regulator